MVSKERFVNGALRYVEQEVLPHFPEMKAVVVAGVVALYAKRTPQIFEKLESIPAVKMIHVLEDGNIDEDALYNAFAPQIRKPLEFDIPFVGKLSFDRAEVDKLLRYIKEA